LRLKLTIIFVSIATLAVLLTASVTFHRSQQALKTAVFNKLTAIREMKARQIEDYFGAIEGQIRLLSEDDSVISAMIKLQNGTEKFQLEEIDQNHIRQYYENELIARMPSGSNLVVEELLPGNSIGMALQETYVVDNPNKVGEKDNFLGASDDLYGRTHRKYHPFFRNFIKEFGYYDLFLVNSQGVIVYTVFKEVDLGTSLLHGPYMTTNFADVFWKAFETEVEKTVFFSDFEPYPPSYFAPAAFVASPIFADGEKIGVIALQFPIERINKIMTDDYKWRSVGLGESGETYLVGPDFRLRSQSRFLIEATGEFFSQIESIEKLKHLVPTIRRQNTTISLLPVETKGTKAALTGAEGTEVFDDYRGIPVLSSYRPLKLHDLMWVIMSEIDAAEAFSPIRQLRMTAFFITLVIVSVVIFVAVLTARSITGPLLTLSYFSKDLAEVDFRKDETDKLVEKIESIVNRKDEVGDLAKAFASLSTNLKDSVRNLISVEIEKERMASELNIAANIQSSMLPLTFPRFPEHSDIDVWAKLRPAREIGGDFYDFFFIDESHFSFIVADVSGKGAPAALFMAVTKTLIKANALDTLSPSIILERINNELSENNDDCMFVTLFLGILDVSTGDLTYSNAGHNPSLLLDTDENINILSDIHGPMLGALPDIQYDQAKIRLGVDSKIVLYTDGVTEAFNEVNEQYGEERLFDTLKETFAQGTKEIVSGIFASVDRYVGNTDQSDDITVFCLRYVAWGKRDDAGSIDILLKNDHMEIERALKAFVTFCNRVQISADVQNRVSTVLDDLLNNVISYAFKGSDKEHDIEVTFRADRHRLIVTVTDDGVEFDPFLREIPDIESDIETRQIGGLGIHMIKSIMDEYSYKRIGDHNKITLIKRLNNQAREDI